jgi:serine/threonine protein kinase/tetratricopeptide (TPR) repeat protein
MSASRARAIFIELVAQVPPEQWEGRLADLAGEDQELRAKVAALLAAHRKADSFLEEPAAHVPASGDLIAGVRGQESGVSKPGSGKGSLTSDPCLLTPGEGPGTTIGPYKLLEEIGEGGMGAVWMAEQREPVQRKVALKIIKAGMDSRQVVARFEAERQALALMDHPNIARVFDGGTTDSGRPYFVMELVKGVPITRYCDEHRLTPRERLELFLPVCQAIQHAHQKGIIHRDVKPANVLVAPYDGRPVPKVIDFGVAKATGQRLTERTLFTGLGAVVGTLEYMSPEQAELNNQDIDTRSDIYALGVLLYELLTGTTPLSHERLKQAAFTEMLRLIREEEPPKPSTRLSESKDTLPAVAAQRHMEPARLTRLVRGELDWIVMKALDKDRSRRYETANGLARDVQHYLADEPVQACPPSAWYRVRKFARRNKAGLAVAAGAFLAVTVMAVTIGWAVRDRAAREAEIEQAEIRKQAEKERAETTRRAKVESQVRAAVKAARMLIVENKLAVARQELAAARVRLGSDPAAFGDLGEEIKALEAELEKLARFLDWIDRAHKAQSALQAQLRLPPGELAADIGFRLRALACYQVLERDDWLARLEGGPLGPAQVAQVRRAVYEELLQLARKVVQRPQDHRSGRRISAPAAGRAGLAYLQKAGAAFSPTAAFYRIRAQCRKALGEKEAARADEALSRHTLATIALDHYLLAIAAYEARNKAEAVRHCEAALRLEPTHYWSLHGLGNILVYLGRQKEDFTSAAVAYTGCIMQRPDYALPYSCRAGAYAKLHRYHNVLADRAKAIELDPKDAAVRYNLGLASSDLGQLAQALADYAKAIELDPKCADAWNNRGKVYLDQGLPAKALADCSKAIELDPKLAVAWNNRGNAFTRLGQPAKAVADCSQAIALDPNVALAWGTRGAAYRALGQPAKALTDFTKAVELDPKEAKHWVFRGVVYLDLGQRDKALADYSKAIELDPTLMVAWYNRGMVFLKLGQPEKAVADFSKAIELDPKFAQAWLIRSEAHLKLGQLDKGLADFSKAIKLKPECAGPWFSQLFRALHGLGKDAAAAHFCAGAFAAQPWLASWPGNWNRYNAACSAARAGCGQGQDAAKLDETERARLRRQALNWLRADLAIWKELLAKQPDKARARVQQTLRHWQQDADLAGVRGDALAKLPEAERQTWQQLWADVEQTLKRVNRKDTKDTKKKSLK